MITVEKFLDDIGRTIRAKFEIESLADAIGCEPHERASLAGQCVCEPMSFVDADTGEEFEPDAWSYEILTREAMKEAAR